MRVNPSALLLIVFALVASACSADSSSSSTAPPPTASIAPFDAVLVELFGTANTDAYRASIEERASQLAVECMEAAGFELQITTPPPFVAPDPADPALTQELGFGIVAEYRHDAAAAQLALRPDPNRPFLETLTAAEIQRFLVTLNGQPAEPGQLPTNTGCIGTATAQASADWERFSMALPNYNAIGEERDIDPRWIAAREAWRQCMAALGLDYADPETVRSDALARMRPTLDEALAADPAPQLRADGQPFFGPETEAALADLLLFEQQVAGASIDCRNQNADVFYEAEFGLQQTFVDRNRAMIDELLAANS